MTGLLRPYLFAKALYLDRRQRKRIERLEEETLAKVDQLLNENSPINLELGHTHIQSDGWITLDQNLACDCYWDLRNGLPFPTNSIDVLYAHKILQRLSGRQLDFLLKDCSRALKPGGAFFFSVPDAEPILKSYAEGQRYFEAHPESIWKPGWHDTGSRMDQVSYMAYCNGHTQFLFDRENVVHLCQQAGFSATDLRAPDPKMDGPAKESGLLYVIARKRA